MLDGLGVSAELVEFLVLHIFSLSIYLSDLLLFSLGLYSVVDDILR